MPHLVLVPLLLVTAACGPAGPSAATDDRDFVSCAEAAGVPLDDLDDLSGADEAQFWERPGAGACAVQELDDGVLAESIGQTFSDPDDADDPPAAAQAQQRVVTQVGRDLTSANGEDEALAGLERLFRAREGPAFEEGLVVAGAMSVVLAADGSIPGYDDFLTRTDQPDGSSALISFYDEQLRQGPESFRDRLRPVVARLTEASD